jgi:hypothetical protein
VLLALVGVSVFRWLASGTAKAPGEGAGTSLEASRQPHEWQSEAEQYEAKGEWKLGLRARYRSLVSELIHRRQLRDIPGRTTGEIEVQPAPRGRRPVRCLPAVRVRLVGDGPRVEEAQQFRARRAGLAGTSVTPARAEVPA